MNLTVNLSMLIDVYIPYSCCGFHKVNDIPSTKFNRLIPIEHDWDMLVLSYFILVQILAQKHSPKAFSSLGIGPAHVTTGTTHRARNKIPNNNHCTGYPKNANKRRPISWHRIWVLNQTNEKELKTFQKLKTNSCNRIAWEIYRMCKQHHGALVYLNVLLRSEFNS